MAYAHESPLARYEVMRLLVWLDVRDQKNCDCLHCRYTRAAEFCEMTESRRKRIVQALCSMTTREWVISRHVPGMHASCLLLLLRPDEFEQWISRWAERRDWSGADLRTLARTARSAAGHPDAVRELAVAAGIPEEDWGLRGNFLLHPRLHPVFIRALLGVYPDRKSRLEFFPQILPVASSYPELAGALREWNRRRDRESAAPGSRSEMARTRAWYFAEPAVMDAEIVDELRSMGFRRALDLVVTERPEWQGQFPREWRSFRRELPESLEAGTRFRVLQCDATEAWLSEFQRDLATQLDARAQSRRNNLARDRVLHEMESLSVAGKMERIAGASRPLTYYPAAWAREYLSDPPALPEGVRHGLLRLGARVTRRRHRDWQRLVEALRQGVVLPAPT